MPSELARVRTFSEVWQPAALTLLFLCAAVVTIVSGGLAALAVMLIGLGIVLGIARLVAEPADRRYVLLLALVAVLARDLAAGTLDLVLFAIGRQGALFDDDFAYIGLAADLAKNWRGEPVVLSTDPSLVNSYVELAGLLFWAVGKNVIALKLLNVVLAAISGLLTYRTMVNLGMPGGRLAALLMLAFPSLFLWSILTLKDSFSLATTVICVWTVSEFIRSQRSAWFLGTIGTLLVMESVRRYVMLIMVVAWPASFLVVPMRPWQRLRALTLSLLSAGLVLAWVQPWEYYGSGGLAAMTFTRSAMAQQARSAFVEAQPIVAAAPGEHFQISVAGGSGDCRDRRVVEVEPGTELVVEGSDRERVVRGAPLRGMVVYVRACDIVRIVARGSTPEGGASIAAPTPTATLPAQMMVVVLQPEAQNLVAAPPPPATEAVSLAKDLLANVTHLPVGAYFLVVAPFPLTARTALEVAAIPEMLVWYSSLGLGLFGAMRLVQLRNFRYAYGALVMIGIALVLSLIEGNVGTLVRHRAMVIAFIVVFSAVGLEELLTRRRGRQV